MPFTIVILIVLFAAQSRGTARVASFFAPGHGGLVRRDRGGGLLHIRDDPRVIAAINPVYAVTFLFYHGDIGLVTLGLVFLVVTGGEALYADLGHFGRKPIQTAWFGLVLPSLLLNYFGQGAKVLADPTAIENPFYRLVPDILLLPMVVLATAATVIASQAVITGAYSLVHQAIQLGLLPRLAILHTSASQAGQIYIPRVTGALLIGVLLLVGVFRSSERARLRLRHRGRHHDGGGRGAGLHRDLEAVALAAVAGGLLVVAPLILVDVDLLLRQPAQAARRRLGADPVRRIDGADHPDLAARHQHPCPEDPAHRSAARYFVGEPGEASAAHGAGHGGVSHQPAGIRADRAAAQSQAQQGAARAQRHPHHHHRGHAARDRRGAGADHGAFAALQPLALKFGYMETPNVPKALAIARKHGWQFDIMSTSFFLSRRALKPAAHSGMPRWQDHLFIALAKIGERRHGLLPDPDRAGGRGRHAGHGVTPLAAVKK